MESPEPQFNAKEEKRVIIRGGVLFLSVGCACWPLLVFGAPWAQEQEQVVSPFKTLKALNCSCVPGDCFLTEVVGQTPGTTKKC